MSSKKGKSKAEVVPSTKEKTKGQAKDQQEVPQGPTRQELFGNWTGKLPINLLQEFIQKQGGNGWLKPIYNFNQNKKGQYSCRISLGKKNKKTGEIENIVFYPKDEYYPSKQESKHASCTYALHRLCSDKPMHLLLPPSMRVLWTRYDGWKHDKDPDIVPFEYSCDPWDAREKQVHHVEKSAAQERSNPWDEYPQLYIPKDLRDRLETMMRDNLDLAINSNHVDVVVRDTKQVKSLLLKKGFREAHVVESLEYHSNITEALDWLHLHVPEDDLPLDQRPKDNKSIVLSNQTAEELAKQYMLDRLFLNGFSKNDCLKALEETNWNEYLALSLLCHEFIGHDGIYENMELDESENLDEILDQEKEVLESIYNDAVLYQCTPAGVRFSIELESISVSICIPANHEYPYKVPGIVLSSSKHPAYIRLALLQKIMMDAVTNFVGSPMVFSIVQAIEEHLPAILENPPKLISLYTRGKSIQLPGTNKEKDDGKKRRKQNGKRKNQGGPSSTEMLSEKRKKLESDEKYKTMLKTRQSLPSFHFKDKIIKSLQTNQVLIICGETGCGKSTQTAQFILDYEIDSERGQDCMIMCTQPRRISATSLAERVADERAESVGQQIGYSIRGESKQSDKTKVVFCTTGVLLRMVQSDTELSHITHVIIDEVHERGVESDFLLVLLRDLLPRRPDLKVVLMSATINATMISDYFDGCPVLEIPGRTFPVTEFYLEDILNTTGYIPENTRGIKTGKKDDQDPTAEWDHIFEKLDNLNVDQKNKLLRLEKSSQFEIDYGLISACVKLICSSNEEGAILIFLPGVMEIKKAITRIKNDLTEYIGCLEIFPLHSMLTNQEQSSVFKKMPKGKRKVVVSTNIAETSVTIDDVVFVIDTGRVKEMKLNNVGILSLTEVWASRAACKQRKGRAGRVKPGKAYKLFSSFFETQYMPNHSEPEILRLPLEQLCLQIKAMGILDVGTFLGKALSPPPISNIHSALDLLESVNALGKDGRLTALGNHVSLLPTDVRVGKMLVFGAIFKCLDPILTIGACISGKGPFNSPLDKREEASEAQKKYANSKSDFLAFANAFDEWQSVKGRGAQKALCEERYLSMTNLMSISDLRKQFIDLLREIGYVSKDNYNDLNVNSKNEKIVKSVILAGVFPNVASIKMPKQVYDNSAEGAVAVDAKSSEIKYFADQERVFLHPSSTLFSEYKFEEKVIAYGTKVATSKIFLRDCTVAPSCALLLLGGGEIKTLHGGNSVSIASIRFQSFPRVTTLIGGMRRLLDIALEEKIKHPSADVIDTEIGKLCLDLLQSS